MCRIRPQNDCGTLLVTNLFAYRATDPELLRAVSDPVGPKNDHHTLGMFEECNLAIVAWGANEFCKDRAAQVMAYLKDANSAKPIYALGLTQRGAPRHPSRFPYGRPLVEYYAVGR